MNKYRVAGCAFGGDVFDDIVESELSFHQFAEADITELSGGDEFAAIDLAMVNPNKLIVGGLERLYFIEKLK